MAVRILLWTDSDRVRASAQEALADEAELDTLSGKEAAESLVDGDYDILIVDPDSKVRPVGSASLPYTVMLYRNGDDILEPPVPCDALVPLTDDDGVWKEPLRHVLRLQEKTARLLRQKEQAAISMERYSSLYSILSLVSSSGEYSLQAMCREILEIVALTASFDVAGIISSHKKDGAYPVIALALAEGIAREPLSVGKDTLIALALEELDSHLSGNLSAEPFPLLDSTELSDGLNSAAIHPVWAQGELAGVLFLASRQGDAYSQEQHQYFREVASAVALAIDRSHHQETDHKRTAHLDLLHEHGTSPPPTLSLGERLQAVTDSIRKKFDYYSVNVFWADRDTGHSVLKASSGAYEKLFPVGAVRMPLECGLIGEVFRTGRVVLVNDVTKSKEYYELDGITTKSELVVPITLDGQTLGALNIESDCENAFDEEDIVVMETLVQQITWAIQELEIVPSSAMVHEKLSRPPFVGREGELEKLHNLAADVGKNGRVAIVVGDDGLGKTRLLERLAEDHPNFRSVYGKCLPELEGTPFGPLLAEFPDLEEKLTSALTKRRVTKVTDVFLLHRGGTVIYQIHGEGKQGTSVDDDLFGGMLTAVLSFVKDTLASRGEHKMAAGSMSYGGTSILIEPGKWCHLACVIEGREQLSLKEAMRDTIKSFETDNEAHLSNWKGLYGEMPDAESLLKALTGRDYIKESTLSGEGRKKAVREILAEVEDRLDRLAEKAPLLLHLDDVQWADSHTLKLLDFIHSRLKEKKLLLCMTLSPESLRSSKKLDELLDIINPLAGKEGIVNIELSRLELEDVSELVRTVFSPSKFDDQFIKSVYDASWGNPLFALEGLRGLMESGQLVMRGGSWIVQNPEDMEFPDSLKELISKKLGLLPEKSLKLLSAASVIGNTFSLECLLSLSGLSEQSLVEEIDHLVHKGYIQEMPDGENFHFMHSGARDLLYDSLSNIKRRFLHGKVADWLLDAHGDELDKVIFVVADHYLNSRSAERAAEYAAKAGNRALRSAGVEKAVEYYMAALDSTDRLKTPGAQERKSRILIDAGIELLSNGEHDHALKLCEKAHTILGNDQQYASLVDECNRLSILAREYKPEDENGDSGNGQ